MIGINHLWLLCQAAKGGCLRRTIWALPHDSSPLPANPVRTWGVLTLWMHAGQRRDKHRNKWYQRFTWTDRACRPRLGNKLWVKTTDSVSLNSEELFTHGALQRESQYPAVAAKWLVAGSLLNSCALCSDTLNYLLPYGSIAFGQNPAAENNM